MEPPQVLDFWFNELNPKQWFFGGEDVDRLVRDRFEGAVRKALEGALDDWAVTPKGRLALILVLDQFTRNIFRDNSKSYAGDAKAQALTLEGLEMKMDEQLTFAERHFFYIPLMHAEDKKLQDLSLQKYTELRDYAEGVLTFAKDHQSIVERFGRFPHRNASLGRESTADEEKFLQSNENHFK